MIYQISHDIYRYYASNHRSSLKKVSWELNVPDHQHALQRHLILKNNTKENPVLSTWHILHSQACKGQAFFGDTIFLRSIHIFIFFIVNQRAYCYYTINSQEISDYIFILMTQYLALSQFWKKKQAPSYVKINWNDLDQRQRYLDWGTKSPLETIYKGSLLNLDIEAKIEQFF